MSARWDKFFLRIAETVAEQSLCLNRRIGAVLVRQKRIIATGYNGPPEGITSCRTRPEGDLVFSKASGLLPGTILEECPRRYLGLGHGEGRQWCPATHAEVNAIVNSARVGVSCAGAVMYLTCGVPCKNCFSVILNAGIREIVCTSMKVHDELTPWLLANSTITIRTYQL